MTSPCLRPAVAAGLPGIRNAVAAGQVHDEVHRLGVVDERDVVPGPPALDGRIPDVDSAMVDLVGAVAMCPQHLGGRERGRGVEKTQAGNVQRLTSLDAVRVVDGVPEHLEPAATAEYRSAGRRMGRDGAIQALEP